MKAELIIFVFLAQFLGIFGLGSTQSVAVRGRLLCNSYPASGIVS